MGAPADLLQPLPVPSCPWSHIALDFVTGLPPSQGNSVILTAVGRISKAVHFVALAKLPSAKETADLLMANVFRLHGIPADIVFNRGPQFISQVWGEFCSALGAKVSLTSGFNPQSKGQAERANQDLETELRCVTATNPTTWSTHLPWIEYAHNSDYFCYRSLPLRDIARVPAPPFPIQEEDIAVPLIQVHLRHCRNLWRDSRATLLRSAEANKRNADRLQPPTTSQVREFGFPQKMFH